MTRLIVLLAQTLFALLNSILFQKLKCKFLFYIMKVFPKTLVNSWLMIFYLVMSFSPFIRLICILINTIKTAIISPQPSISLKQNFTKNSFILLGIIRKSGDRGMNKEKNSKSRWQSKSIDFYPTSSEEKKAFEVQPVWTGLPVAVRRRRVEVCSWCLKSVSLCSYFSRTLWE